MWGAPSRPGSIICEEQNPLDFRQAAAIYLAVRRQGKTVRSLVNCLIAAIALRSDVLILHKDADYAAIARCLPLREHPPDR